MDIIVDIYYHIHQNRHLAKYEHFYCITFWWTEALTFQGAPDIRYYYTNKDHIKKDFTTVYLSSKNS